MKYDIHPLKIDPIRTDYFDAVERLDGYSDLLFYLSAALSIIILFTESWGNPLVHRLTTLAFILSVVFLFIFNGYNRWTLMSAANEQRSKDFLGKAFNLSLIDKGTTGYYNNQSIEPFKKMAAQILENTLFSRAIVSKMLVPETVKALIYFAVWIAIFVFGSKELSTMATVTQILFSEQVFSKPLRMFWLKGKCNEVYGEVRSFIQLSICGYELQAYTLAALVKYESAKSNAALTLSSKIFDELNPTLIEEWNQIKITLNI